MSAIVNVETTAEVKFNANVRVDLEDSVYQVSIESCRLYAQSYNCLIKGSIQADIKIFDETERNTATLKLNDSEFSIKHGLSRRFYSASSDCISIENIVFDSDLSRSSLYNAIDDNLLVDMEVTII